jgi:hypothetical protein
MMRLDFSAQAEIFSFREIPLRLRAGIRIQQRSSMINKFTPVSRRKFLRQGIGVSALFLLMPKKLPFFLSKRFDRSTYTSADSKDDLLLVVAQKYGSEFGDIKPQGRRINHGRV